MDYDFDQLTKMRMGCDYRFPVLIRKFSVLLRPLTNTETIEVTNQVFARMAGMSEHQKNRINENSIVAKETLKLASTEQPDSKDIPQLTDPILDRLTNEELSFIYDEYVAICDKCNPSFDLLPKEAIEKLVEEAKKKPTDLTGFSLLQLASMVNYFITRAE